MPASSGGQPLKVRPLWEASPVMSAGKIGLGLLPPAVVAAYLIGRAVSLAPGSWSPVYGWSVAATFSALAIGLAVVGLLRRPSWGQVIAWSLGGSFVAFFLGAYLFGPV